MAPSWLAAYVIGWLQANLQKVGLLWRESNSDLEGFQEGKEAQALRGYEKNLLLMGSFFLFLSWLGFFFNLLVLISVHSWAVSRKERFLFSSALTEQDLLVEQVQEILKEFPT
ncbi:hypothetical protein [Bdellovibrio sp. ArHS]|uniref:hypothetical protein n=1 Tax=Bdellovibrio sp. ArHS TaxID=1569284 RepID=UPI000AE4778D|nr:hypothetical protein [Bdellovibrio sp. ArHS]